MTPQEIAQRLFFVVGCGRSGTTLLKSMLDAHPRIQMPPETFFFSTIKQRFPGTASAPIEEKLQYVSRRWWIRDAGIGAQDLRHELEAFSHPGWRELFLATLAAMLPEADQQVLAVGEKTPAHISSAQQLLEDYPDSRVIQIVRDPRAVLASYRGVKVGTNQAAGVIREWRNAWQQHCKLEGHLRYLLVRYEDLVADVEIVLRQVCTCLGIPFDAGMLSFHTRDDKGFATEQAHHRSTLKPLFQSSLDAWKQKLSLRQQALVEVYLTEGMADYGYAPSAEGASVGPLDLLASEACERLHRHAVRRPRQIVKRMRALRRLRQEKAARSIAR